MMRAVLGAPHHKPAGWRVLEGGEADGMRHGHTLWEHSQLRKTADESLRWTRNISKRRGASRGSEYGVRVVGFHSGRFSVCNRVGTAGGEWGGVAPI
jgi:hypothetical protein